MRKRGPFIFKHFSCRHSCSSMPIGVDAVLLGAWADVAGSNILDVGTGCGVIALMCAQRNPDAIVNAIDIDAGSVDECHFNFHSSPWSDRLSVRQVSFDMMESLPSYDLIISNPPYFNSGVNASDSLRMTARHEGSLSPEVLLRFGKRLLNPDGRIAMIVPWIRADEILNVADETGLFLRRRTDVRGNFKAPLKRSMLEFGLRKTNSNSDILTLESAPGKPTDEHLALCHEFYLKF